MASLHLAFYSPSPCPKSSPSSFPIIFTDLKIIIYIQNCLSNVKISFIHSFKLMSVQCPILAVIFPHVSECSRCFICMFPNEIPLAGPSPLLCEGDHRHHPLDLRRLLSIDWSRRSSISPYRLLQVSLLLFPGFVVSFTAPLDN